MPCQTFSVTLVIAGLDVTARLLGPVVTEAAENASALLDFSLTDETPVSEGQPVILAVNDGTTTATRFTGTLRWPEHDIDNRLYRCQTCTGWHIGNKRPKSYCKEREE